MMVFGPVACKKDNPEGSGDGDGTISVSNLLKTYDLAAVIEWTYALDADTDNALFYTTDPADYSRKSAPISAKSKKLFQKLKSTCPLSAEVMLAYNRNTNSNEDPSTVYVDIISTEDGEPVVYIYGFKWDMNYIFSVNCNGKTLTGAIATVDRNRDVIEIELPEYVARINDPTSGYDKSEGTYKSPKTDFSETLFQAFVDNKIINCDPGHPDFADAAAFAGKEGKLKKATRDGDSGLLAFGNVYAYANFTAASRLKKIWQGNKCLVRHISTYCGQIVRLKMPVSVELPDYDFLHLTSYTFNTKKESVPFINKSAFEGNDGSVEWWISVNPFYKTGATNAYGEPISFRHVLKEYDVAYVDLAELAFNIVDANDNIMSDADIEAAGLSARFEYADKALGKRQLPDEDVTSKYSTYKDLWVDKTIFYYRTNEKRFIPVRGILEVTSGDAVFEIPTRFDRPKESVEHPGVQLDYSSFAVVGWNPFKPIEAEGFTIVLDEHKIYQEYVLQSLNIKDNRPNGVSYDVMKNGKWVNGNVLSYNAEDGTYPAGGNGYLFGTRAYTAYGINAATAFSLEYSIPNHLKKMVTIDLVGKDPYIFVDYTSEVQFQGTVDIGVTLKLNNPWADARTEFNITIKGID